MRIAVLTSSRADYGIYLPLLKRMKDDRYFELCIVVFGTHLSHFHGYTVNNIINDEFEIYRKIETLILGDSTEAVSNAIGNTVTKFSSFWEDNAGKIDLVLALGDRYEMFAAVVASVPFNIKTAHIHGGETTLGAIDNKFRHSISLMSDIHFASTDDYCKRIENITGVDSNIYNVGALSLDNILDIDLLELDKFKKQFQIDLSIPSILVTFHPETVKTESNKEYSEVLSRTLQDLSNKYQIIITLPNADSMGNIIRESFTKLSTDNPKIICVENFGTLGYFSCMSHCSFLLGNTSSGIIEAASFGKYVINLGDRQKGRARSNNVIDSRILKNDILERVLKIEAKPTYTGGNIYQQTTLSSNLIIKALKHNEKK